ncbi:hypothetical protein SEA_BOOPY_186 [Gordonia phage Boopy]|nr:hypothetical protein SEA_BOOPY_186 [Gordonia phage Boopy]
MSYTIPQRITCVLGLCIGGMIAISSNVCVLRTVPDIQIPISSHSGKRLIKNGRRSTAAVVAADQNLWNARHVHRLILSFIRLYSTKAKFIFVMIHFTMNQELTDG